MELIFKWFKRTDLRGPKKNSDIRSSAEIWSFLLTYFILEHDIIGTRKNDQVDRKS